MDLKKIAYFFIVTIAIVVMLTFGQSLIIPFVFALLLWFIIRRIRFFFDRVDFIKTRFPSWAKNLIASLAILTILALVSQVLTSSIDALSASYERYEANIETLIGEVNKSLHIDLGDMVKEQWGHLDFGALLGSIFTSLSDILGSTFMILIYALFIFLEEVNFLSKLRAILPEGNRFEAVSGVMARIEAAITKYLGLKTLVSLITGVLSYFALLLIGIDSPIFWAFLIFLLNFIPTIGSLIATVFPAIFCLLQFGEFTPGLMVLLIVGAIQLLVGNVLEPRLMGNSLNLSALGTIVALSFWGAIWGVTGMLLSVPITVITVIVFSQFPATRSIAILFSEKGKIN